MTGALHDKHIMPVKRYIEARCAFSVYIKHTTFCQAIHVVKYQASLKQRRCQWKTFVKAVRMLVVLTF